MALNAASELVDGCRQRWQFSFCNELMRWSHISKTIMRVNSKFDGESVPYQRVILRCNGSPANGGAIVRLYISKLDKDMRERIETARYTEMKLEGIRGIRQRAIDVQTNAAYGVVALFVVIDAYALWQVINIPPVVVGFAVIVQIAFVGVFGSCLGLALCWVSSSTVFSALFMDIDLFEGVRILPGFSLCPAVLGVSLFLSVLGGARAARAAACTPPVMALRDEWSVEGASERMMPLRWLAALAACAAAAWCVSTVDPVLAPVDFGQSTWLVFLPIVIPALITALAPVLLPRILRAATCPLSRWTAWLLARRSAQHGLTQCLSIETSLVVAMGVVAGFYSMMSLMERYATAYDLPIGSGFGLDPRLACVMFAGPVILAAVGSCANVVLALRVRERDASLLEVLGATPRQVCVVSVLEAFMHVTTAGSAALLAVVLSNMIAAHALGLGAGSAMLSVRFAPAVLIAVAGFVVLVVAGLMPVLRMIRTAPVRFLNE